MGKKLDKKERKEIEKFKKISNKLPKQAILQSRDEELWNFIPLGITLDSRGKETTIGWYLNEEEKLETAYDTLPSTSLLIAGSTGSGKTVIELGIINHVKKYRDKFQLVGSDCKRVEFNRFKNDFNGLALDIATTASAVTAVRDVMMKRFNILCNLSTNNVWKVEDKQPQVPYYDVKPIGKTLQFDHILTFEVDLDPNDRHYAQLSAQYPDGKQPIIDSIDSVYNRLKSGAYDKIYIDGKAVTIENIKETSGIYKPTAIMLMIDELAEVMSSEDYKSVDAVKTALGSISRLGRPVGVFMVLGCQRASGSVISTDLKNNINMSILLGNFDDAASCLMFEKDISNYCRPDIKGRGFIGSGNEILETQMFIGKVDYFI